MTATWYLSSIGLLLSTIAALWMARYPLEGPKFSKDGGPIGAWEGTPTAEGKRAYEAYTFKSKWGLRLLAIGFGMQFLSVLLPVFSKS